MADGLFQSLGADRLLLPLPWPLSLIPKSSLTSPGLEVFLIILIPCLLFKKNNDRGLLLPGNVGLLCKEYIRKDASVEFDPGNSASVFLLILPPRFGVRISVSAAIIVGLWQQLSNHFKALSCLSLSLLVALLLPSLLSLSPPPVPSFLPRPPPHLSSGLPSPSPSPALSLPSVLSPSLLAPSLLLLVPSS